MGKPAPPPGHVAVRFSIRPDEEAFVPEDEVPILRQQGLLAEPAAPAADKTPAGGKDPA